MKNSNPLVGLLPPLRLLLLVTLTALAACDAATQFGKQDLPETGKWRVINYWALWCTPCREEIPELNAVHARDTIHVLGVNYDRKTGDELADHRQQLGIEFPSLDSDPESLFSINRPSVLPTTLIIDPEGRLVATLVGPQTAESLLAAMTPSN